VLLSIMAQLGCYVPAERATFRIPDRIFSRVNNRDCLETNASTFMLEMQETAFILANVSSSSLVIIDELGRGTSLKEGASICWAVCEKLLPSKAFVFLATHFKLMTEMADLHPCVENYQFLTESMEDGCIRYTHQMARGTSLFHHGQTPHYGIDLAASVLPSNIVDTARTLAAKIDETELKVKKLSPMKRLSLDTVVRFKKLKMSGLQGKELLIEFNRVKQEYIEEKRKLESHEQMDTSTLQGDLNTHRGTESAAAEDGTPQPAGLGGDGVGEKSSLTEIEF